MAMDEAILDAVESHVAPPTVRLYTWDGPTVTVGRNQDVSSGVDIAFCSSEMVPIVRRPTGGRGILHGADLTVSVVMPLETLPATSRSVIGSYRYLSKAFLEALLILGIDGAMGECDRRAVRGGDCFTVRSAADVVAVAGQKVVGSAQRRRGQCLLQQSSIHYRRPEYSRAEVFLGPVEDSTYPLQNVPANRLVEAITLGFAVLFGRHCERAIGPSGWEEERCATLIHEYAPLVL